MKKIISFAIFVFTFMIIFSATQETPIYNIHQGTNDIYLDISNYGCDVQMRVKNPPLNFTVTIDNDTISPAWSGSVEREITVEVPSENNNFEETVDFEIFNPLNSDHPNIRTFSIHFRCYIYHIFNVPGTVYSDDGLAKVTVPEDAVLEPDYLTIYEIDNDTVLSEMGVEELNNCSNVYDIYLSSGELINFAEITLMYSDEGLSLEDEYKIIPIIWNPDEMVWEDATGIFSDIIRDTDKNEIILRSEHFSAYTLGILPVITNKLHFTELDIENSCFSPNGDNVKDDLTINTKMNKPGNIDIKIYDESKENLLRNFSVPYNNEDPLNIIWNGIDNNSILLLDGVYYLTVQGSSSEELTSQNIFKIGIDTLPPDIIVSGVEDNGLYNEYIFPVITYRDENSCSIKVKDNGNEIFKPYRIIEAGNHVLDIEIIDIAGNRAESSYNFIIDLTPPTVFIRFSDPNYLYNCKLYISKDTEMGFTSDDGNVYYSFDYENWIHYTEDFYNDLSEGERRIYYYALDLAGNRSSNKSFIFINDYSPPETNIVYDFSYYDGNTYYLGENSLIGLNSYDNLSGVFGSYIKIDENPYFKYSEKINASGLSDGLHSLSFYSEDNVENIEDEKNENFIIDRTPPVIKYEITPSDIVSDKIICYRSSILTIWGEDEASGYSYSQYSISDNPNDEEFINYTETISFSSFDIGLYYLKIKCYDNLGNESGVLTETLFITPAIASDIDNDGIINIAIFSRDSEKIEEIRTILQDNNNIWKIGVGEEPNNFDVLIDSNIYNSFLLLDGKNLNSKIAGRLTEKLFFGNPIFSFGNVGIAEHFKEIFGIIKYGYFPSGIYGISILNSELSLPFSYIINDKPIKINEISENCEVKGIMDDSEKPSVVKNCYGRGKSLIFNHRLFADIPDNLEKMINNSVELLRGPEYNENENYPLRIIPLRLTVKNNSNDTISIKIELNSDGITLLETSKGEIINNEVILYNDIGPLSTIDINLMIKLPEEKGNYTLNEIISIKNNGIYVPIKEVAISYPVTYGIEELYDVVMMKVDEMAEELEGEDYDTAVDIYNRINQLKQNSPNININELLSIIKDLSKINSDKKDAIRIKLDMILNYYEVKGAEK